jgi:hypothetical protein
LREFTGNDGGAKQTVDGSGAMESDSVEACLKPYSEKNEFKKNNECGVG